MIMSSLKKIYSGVMGKACQECNIPPNCILEASITFGDKTDVYRKENHFFKRYTYLIEPKKGRNVLLKLTATPMNCVSHNPSCPMGNVFNEDGSLYADFSAQKSLDGVLSYRKPMSGFSLGENNPISLLDSFIYRQSFIDDPRYRQRYSMRLSECGAVPFLTIPKAMKLLRASFSPMTHGAVMLFQEGRRHLASAQFDLILYRELKVEVEVGFESEIKDKKSDDRQAEQKAKNIARGYKPTHGGWTKRTHKYDITRGLSIKGEITSITGDEEVTFNAELKKEFIQHKNKLSFTNSIDMAFDKISSVLSSGNKVKYPIVKTEFCYPTLNINGGIKTHQSSDYGVITQGNVSVGFAPLFGFQITLDLLTVFAAYAHIDFIVSDLRASLEEKKEEVEEGKEGYYATMELTLTFSFGLHGNFNFKTNDEGNFESDGRSIKLQGELIGKAHLEAGVNYWGIQGFFEIGAEITTSLQIEFDKEKGDDLTAVIYHDGITAKVYNNYSVGNNKVSRKSKVNTNGKISVDKDIKKWVIYEAMDKDESEWRFTLG